MSWTQKPLLNKNAQERMTLKSPLPNVYLPFTVTYENTKTMVFVTVIKSDRKFNLLLFESVWELQPHKKDKDKALLYY